MAADGHLGMTALSRVILASAGLSGLDPETGQQALQTLFLLGLLLSDFQSTKAFISLPIYIAYRLKTIFPTIAPCPIFNWS